MQIGVTIVDDNQWEPDEEFFLKLTYVQAEDNHAFKLGRTSIMEITILNDDGNLNVLVLKKLFQHLQQAIYWLGSVWCRKVGLKNYK